VMLQLDSDSGLHMSLRVPVGASSPRSESAASAARAADGCVSAPLGRLAALIWREQTYWQEDDSTSPPPAGFADFDPRVTAGSEPLNRGDHAILLER
jgi:hypothetical protein